MSACQRQGRGLIENLMPQLLSQLCHTEVSALEHSSRLVHLC